MVCRFRRTRQSEVRQHEVRQPEAGPKHAEPRQPPLPTVKQTHTRQVQSGAAPFDPAYGEKAPARQILVNEDEVWVQFGTADAPDWLSKCAECREAVSSWRSPIAPCVNCWKVEVWGSSEILHRVMDWFELGEVAETVARQTGAVIKVSKEPIPVIRSGVPEEGYPKADLDYLLMGYAESIPERDALRQSLSVALSVNPAKADRIPVRRGCWFYDEMLGPWTKWYPVDKDMGGT